MADDASTKPTRPPYGWEEKTDDDGKIHWTSAAGTQVYTMPEEPVYVTHEKVQEWVKLYDARSGKFYFSNSFTGEHGVDTPPLYFKQLKDKLPFPKFLVSALIIQRVARIRRANVRVNCKRAEMHQKFAGAHARYIKTFHPHHHTYYWCNPKEKKYTWEQPQPKDEYDFSIKDKNRAKYPKWFRLWDPSHKQHYYHDTFEGTFQYTQPPEWNAIMWAFGFRSGYPPLLKAALTTQTLYRRKTVARKIETNGQMLENMSTAERRKYMEKKAEELAKRKREMVIRREHEKEANDRAGLAHEEALQRVRGDKFWGLDVAAQAKQHLLEVQRHLKEEKVKAAADAKAKKEEAVERRKQMKDGRRADMKREMIEEEDMVEEEKEQRNYGDTFWGVDRQERDRRKSSKRMSEEDRDSRIREKQEELSLMHERWAKELQQSTAKETLSNATADLKRRGNYMATFYDSQTSNDVLQYVWPGSRTLMQERRRRGGDGGNGGNGGNGSPPPVMSTSGFGMPQVYDKKRLEAPASIYHALNSLRSAPPAAARDFLLDTHQGKGFVLLPHLFQVHAEDVEKNGAVPPEMVQRQIDSRRHTASRSLMSPSRAEAKRMREKEQNATKKHTRRRRKRRGADVEEEGDEDNEEDNEEEEDDDDESRMQDTRSIASGSGDENVPEEEEDDVEVWTGDGGSAILEADVRGVFTSAKDRRKKKRKNKKKKKDGKKSVPNYLKPKSSKSTKQQRNESSKGKEADNSNNTSSSSSSQPPPPPPPTVVIVEFSNNQIARLKTMFTLMDEDKSGYVDQRELMVALRTNKKVIAFIQQSKLLAPLLLDPALGKRFMDVRPSDEMGLSLREFVEFMQDNSDENTVVEDFAVVEREEKEKEEGGGGGKDSTKEEEEEEAVMSIERKAVSADARGNIESLVLRVFNLIDTNNTKTMGRREFLMALKAVPDITDFVRKTPKLQSLFQSKLFLKSFNQLNDPCTLSEFVDLGLRISKEMSSEDAETKQNKK